MSDEAWLEGIISVEAAIEAGSRPISQLFLRQDAKPRLVRQLRRLEKTAVAAHIPVSWVDAAVIDAHASGQTHGGVLAQVGARRFVALADLLAGAERPFIVMLDGVEDPFNFGQSLRSLYAAGATGVVVRPRNWTTAASVVARSSAGASERIPLAVAETADAAAAFFRERGLAIACTSQETAVSIYDSDLTQPLFLLLGGEKRGITRSFLRQADLRLAIPYARQFDPALGTTAATAVLAFERMRQLAHG